MLRKLFQHNGILKSDEGKSGKGVQYRREEEEEEEEEKKKEKQKKALRKRRKSRTELEPAPVKVVQTANTSFESGQGARCSI